ncbi:MAG: 50S ribosomal protein L4 [Candidatus Omnitrophica bacterium]|nr:50S ribosomal protein L4 [Candidatus Omnitrophota bacterium]
MKTKKDLKKARVKKTRVAKASKKRARAKKVREKKTAAKSAKKSAAKENVLSVRDLNGKTLESFSLDPLFSDPDIHTGVIYQTVLMYQAGEREGTASTKDRGHVRGGGKKPWKQKGTGQARHGSRRSPIWRGGGTTFGPMPRDYSYALPGELRRRAVAEGVKEKAAGGKLFVLKQLELAEPKTKLMKNVLEALKLEKPLFLVDRKAQNLLLASRNLPGVTVKTSAEVNALDLVSHRECVMTQAAYGGLLKRLKS